MSTTLLPLLLAGMAIEAAQPNAPVPRWPVIAAYGECLVRQAPAGARRLLSTRIDSRDEREAAGSLAQGNYPCLSGRYVLSMRTGEIRGTIAEAFLDRDPDARARAAALAPRPPVPAGASGGRAFVNEYARCIADAEPEKAVRLLATPHQSNEEGQAFSAFGAVLSTCKGAQSLQLTDIFDIRNHFAARLYERVYGDARAEVRSEQLEAAE